MHLKEIVSEGAGMIRIGTSGKYCEHRKESLGPKKGREYLV